MIASLEPTLTSLSSVCVLVLVFVLLMCRSLYCVLIFNFHFCSGIFNLFLYVVACSHKSEDRRL